MSKVETFATEAELVATFCEGVSDRRDNPWTAYHETAGWDVLLVHQDGYQLGIEAKLSLNAKVLEQALPGRWVEREGPDYRAVLVPAGKVQAHLATLARHVGIVVLTVNRNERYVSPKISIMPGLPDERWEWSSDQWPNWCPAARCKLPDYVPDVTGGHSAPVALTAWKVKAIKLLILLERRGFVTRSDMKALQISPTRWTDRYYGFLAPSDHGYVRCNATPDLKAQHPTNWGQIEADFEKWGRALLDALPPAQGSMFGGEAA